MSVVISGIGIRNAVVTVHNMRNDAVLVSAAQGGDLQYFIEESRRRFAYALEETDPDQRLILLQQARDADKEVQARLASLSSLNLPSQVLERSPEFQLHWLSYLQTRDRAIALLAGGQGAELRRLDSPLTGAFERASAALQDMRLKLTDHAKVEAGLVESTFLRLIFELVLLILTLGWFSWALLGSRSEGNQVREKSEQLARSALLEANRSLVLELTGRNEPLQSVLSALCRLVEQQLPGSVVAVSIFQDGQLKEITGPSMPDAFVKAQHRVRSAELGSNWAAWQSGEAVYSEIAADPRWDCLRDLAVGHGFRASWAHPVLASTGRSLGTVDVYFRTSRKRETSELEALRGAAQLAAMAIEHGQLYEKLSFQSQRDALTELPNRRLLQDRLEQTIAKAKRDNHMAAVLMIDLDWFKQVNDKFGHRAGDAVLHTIAERLSHSVRAGDTVARVGGDEFTVVFATVADAEEAERGARRILDKLCEPISIGERNTQIAASIGISIFPADGEDAATLNRHADLALYHVKSRGRHGCQLYGPQIGSVLRKRMSLETGLARALQNQELELFYQPQTDIHRTLVGMEALIRWTSPEFGAVSPSEFIPVAESSGLIVPIGSWALLEACRQSVAWQKAGYTPVKMAVNVSARQLSEPDFVGIIRRALTASGLGPQWLELELTETTLMEHVEESLDRLRQLRDLGVTIAIDDFGTGYSSLSYLQKLPVANVKIDLSFVRDIFGTSSTIPVIQAIIDLAHGMGLKVVAEGVETEHQLTTLRTLGCDRIQGYLLSRPVPAKQAEAFFSSSTVSLLELNRQIQSTNNVTPITIVPAGSKARR
jgi:diguanylate cyclase (GGDEF)-like protein